MKKFLLTVLAILTIASGSVFGMYGADNTWLFFLIHGNQFRARMNQLGFTLGNGTIKGTFGFKANTLINGSILNTGNKENQNPLEATISAGIGYTGDGFGVGVGYNYTYTAANTIQTKAAKGINTHTPVITFNAVNNNLRVAIPVSIAVEKDIGKLGNMDRKDYLGLSIPAQIRYYTGIDAFNYIRFEFNYGLNKYNGVENNTTTEYQAQTISFQLRLHFLNTVLGNNVTVNPFLRVDFASTVGAKGKGNVVFPASTAFDGRLTAWAANAWADDPNSIYDRELYDLKIIPSVSLSVNTDYVNLIFEPGLGYRVQDDGVKGSKLTHTLYWQAYGEIYIRPVQDLEWYFEMDVNNGVPKLQGNPIASGNSMPVVFGANTGITWYLPALQ
ncbi:variable surface family protein [Brachyspira hyodysenteriae]|uniref:Variable surface protein E n=1 Tax=Brachyspira hyodysenteriae TaxID=159 RepID=F1CJQ4_BRAHO|nr:variable surface family protein [Brachyspira hyodysenteriae]ADZ30935.1 variable surface protein E [Brachyspira hyodysenteriae]AUJ49799.1 variable surface protein VspE [Brachyspira hyodysenteriae]KLI29591.1 cell surface protein [Brachyspira hyodysenteriae]KLI34499.1 cell surface protein [Brachyspira hyodysenteriae]KLI41495.1 cell surface protein [Brachyspira hyodysenteriae]